jgi:hypothetical protein
MKNIIFIGALFFASTVMSSNLVQFQSNTPAKASEVNSNFQELETRISSISSSSEVRSNGRFVGTREKYDGTGYETTVANDACVSEFGSGYRVADWNDIVSFYNSPSRTKEEISELYINLAIKPRHSYGGIGYFISYDGSEIYSGTRHYFLSRHDHNKPGSYLSHANINNHELDIGSWFVKKHALCYKK